MIAEVRVSPTVVELPEGRAWVWTASPHIVATRVEGRMLIEHAEAIIAAIDRSIERHPGDVVALHDWTGIASYQVAVHTRMSAWSIRAVRSMRRIVLAVDSPLVGLAVRTVNLAVGNRFEFVATRELLEGELRTSLR